MKKKKKTRGNRRARSELARAAGLAAALAPLSTAAQQDSLRVIVGAPSHGVHEQSTGGANTAPRQYRRPQPERLTTRTWTYHPPPPPPDTDGPDGPDTVDGPPDTDTDGTSSTDRGDNAGTTDSTDIPGDGGVGHSDGSSFDFGPDANGGGFGGNSGADGSFT